MTRLPDSVRLAVCDRDNWQCRRCGGVAVDVHHRIARGMGGTNWHHQHDMALLVCLCRACHRWIETNRQAARDRYWLLSRSEWGALIESGETPPNPI